MNRMLEYRVKIAMTAESMSSEIGAGIFTYIFAEEGFVRLTPGQMWAFCSMVSSCKRIIYPEFHGGWK